MSEVKEVSPYLGRCYSRDSEPPKFSASRSDKSFHRGGNANDRRYLNTPSFLMSRALEMEESAVSKADSLSVSGYVSLCGSDRSGIGTV